MKNTMVLAGLVSCVTSVAIGQTNLIVDGGFETQNQTVWVISGPEARIVDNPAFAYEGNDYLSLGGFTSGATQIAYQTVTIPTNTLAAELSYYYNVYSTSQSSSDEFGAFIFYPDSDTPTATVDEETGANSAGAEGSAYYLLKTFDLTPWTGQTVEIEFQALSSGATFFNVDDVGVLVETTADIPPNDYFTNRTVLTGTALMVQGNNTFATTEPGEPKIKGNPPSNSLWWSWTAPTNGILSLSTYASSFPNLLAVYTGSSITNLTQVAAAVSADESGNPAQVTVLAEAGTQYQIAVDGYQGGFGEVALTLAFQNDTNPPTISISYPPANAVLTNATVVVQGTAKDDFGVTVVEYRLENAAGTNAYQPATGTTNWSATITNLLAGLNTVRVFAIDTSSNISPTKTRSFTYAVVESLVVTINGEGTLKPRNYNGAILELGKTYAITATAAEGYLFANWTDGASNTLATTTKLSFIMTPGLELVANFVKNPFISLQGTYAGLYDDTNSFSPATAGSCSAKLTSLGGLSAQLELAGAPYRFSGSVSPFGAYSNSIPGPGGKPLALQLQLDVGGTQGLTGTVSTATWSADLVAYQAVYSSANPAPQAAKEYTLVIPGATDPSTGPGGYGYGTLRVNTSGTVTFSGMLGDGTKVSGGSVVLGSGQWPLYLSPSAYAGKGVVWGWLGFVTNGASQDVVGTVNWLKQAGASGTLYPNGFTFTNGVQVIESLYSYTSGAHLLDWTNGVIELAGGDLSPGLTNGVTLANNKLGGTNKLSLRVTTASGLFQGTVPVANSKSGISVSGVLLQGRNAGYGLFLGQNESGSVLLEQ
jgi:hypothetical protein